MRIKWANLARYFGESINTHKEEFCQQGEATSAMLLFRWRDYRGIRC